MARPAAPGPAMMGAETYDQVLARLNALSAAGKARIAARAALTEVPRRLPREKRPCQI